MITCRNCPCLWCLNTRVVFGAPRKKNLTGSAIFYYIIHHLDIVTIWQPVFISGTFISSDLEWMIKTHPVISDNLGVRLSGDVFKLYKNAPWHGTLTNDNEHKAMHQIKAVNTFPAQPKLLILYMSSCAGHYWALCHVMSPPGVCHKLGSDKTNWLNNAHWQDRASDWVILPLVATQLQTLASPIYEYLVPLSSIWIFFQTVHGL